jgi:gluconolactonase
MKIKHYMKKIILLSIVICQLSTVFAQEIRQLTVDKPQAIADLKTTEGAALVNAKWYVQPAHIEDAEFKNIFL